MNQPKSVEHFAELSKSEALLPRCPPEVVESFLKGLRIESGRTVQVYYAEVEKILSAVEYAKLMDRVGLDVNLAIKDAWVTVNGCQSHNGYYCFQVK